jgi:hypothetical protein
MRLKYHYGSESEAEDAGVFFKTINCVEIARAVPYNESATPRFAPETCDV